MITVEFTEEEVVVLKREVLEAIYQHRVEFGEAPKELYDILEKL